VAEWLPRFVMAEADGSVAGVAGLEVYDRDGLLRSVAVADDWRGRGLGGVLTATILAAAKADGLRSVYLLTDTAEGYFPRHGFRRIARSEVPDTVTASVEFRELCPASSAVMVTELRPSSKE
jgi:amino-acid N-acetyltransferase